MFITQVIIIQNWCHMLRWRIYFLCLQLLDAKRWLCSKLDNQHSYFYFSGYASWLHCDDSIVKPTAEQLVSMFEIPWTLNLRSTEISWRHPALIYLSHFYRLCSHHRIVCPTFSSTGDLAKTCNDNKLTKLFLFRRGDTMVGVEKTVKWLQQHSRSIHPSTRILVHLWSSIEG